MITTKEELVYQLSILEYHVQISPSKFPKIPPHPLSIYLFPINLNASQCQIALTPQPLLRILVVNRPWGHNHQERKCCSSQADPKRNVDILLYEPEHERDELHETKHLVYRDTQPSTRDIHRCWWGGECWRARFVSGLQSPRTGLITGVRALN